MRTRFAAIAAMLALLNGWLGVATPAAAAIEYNLLLPLIDDVDSCTGEQVAVTGTQHVISRLTEDGQGQLHISSTRHTQGTGIGKVSGAEYLFVDSVIRSQVTVAQQDDTTYLTEGSQVLLIRKGETTSTDDTILHLVTRWAITADGEMTEDVKIDIAECR